MDLFPDCLSLNPEPLRTQSIDMKWISLLALGGGLTAMAVQSFWPCECPDESGASVQGVEAATASLVSGWFLEARDLSVFAGACHVNSEADAQGQSAVCAWNLAAGEVDGVNLEDLTVVAAIEGEDNLAHGGERRSKLFMGQETTERQRRVVQSWLAAEHGETLGSITGVEVTDLVFERDGDNFRLRAGDAVEISGLAVADGSCCTMKEQRWYEPLAGPKGAVVANPDTCRVNPGKGFTSWSYADANSAFFTEIEMELDCESWSCDDWDGMDVCDEDWGCCEEALDARCDAPSCEDAATACEGQAMVPADACCSSASRTKILN